MNKIDINKLHLSKWVLACVFFLAASCAQSPAYNYNTPLKIGNKKIQVEIVSTSDKMQLGLSGRNSLSDQQGMLFNFKNPSRPGFWMKDMNFNLDLIWIANNKIVQITPDVPAPVKDKRLKINDDSLPIYYPNTEIDAVLEVNAGWSKRYGIDVGEEIRFGN